MQSCSMADDKPLDIVENQLDIAIHIGELADSSYRALPIGKVTELFCATPQYIHQQGGSSFARRFIAISLDCNILAEHSRNHTNQ